MIARSLQHCWSWRRPCLRVTSCLPELRRPHDAFPCRGSSSSMDRQCSSNGLSCRLWNKNQQQAMLALYHPFVVSLASGVLNIDSFRNYIAQDAFFLETFAKAYHLSLQNVDNDASKVSINELRNAVLDELKLHSSYAQAWGVDLSKDIKPNIAATKYTNFLLSIASSGGQSRNERLSKQKLAAFTIGAMTPCMKLYAFLGTEIKRSLDSSYVPTYNEWINTYSSEDFQASTQKIEDVLDNLSVGLSGEDVPQLESLYSQAMDLELEFFSAIPDPKSLFVPLIKSHDCGHNYTYVLISDFDSTCTVSDSCPAIADLSIRKVAKQAKGVDLGNLSKEAEDLKRTWDLLVKSYTDQYNQILSLIENTEKPCKSYDQDGLQSFLEKLSEFEIMANSQVINKGVLKGLEVEDIRKAGSEMPLQDGCSAVLRRVSMLNNVKTFIISVCWSKTFINGTLSKEAIDSVEVHSNELHTDGSQTSGEILQNCQTPLDKERLLTSIVSNINVGMPVQTIYIGDSVTDLLCLLKADVGIVIGSSSTLKRVAQAFGVSLVPLYKGTLDKIRLEGSRGWERTAGVLYTVNSWHEINAFLLGK